MNLGFWAGRIRGCVLSSSHEQSLLPSTPTATATPTPTPTATPDGIFVANSSELKEGQVKIIEVNIAKNQYPSYAFSRLGGQLSAVSIVCTHAGCKVVAEKPS